jgi:hypothetical protein
MRRTLEDVRQLIAALPDHVKDEIIYGVAWNFFGDLDEQEEEYIETARRPDGPDLTAAVARLRLELFEGQYEVRVKEVIRGGELELAVGHTFAEILEQAGECLDANNSWDICGEVLFLGTDDQYYAGTVEFVIGPASDAYIKEVLAEDSDDEEDGDGEGDAT